MNIITENSITIQLTDGPIKLTIEGEDGESVATIEVQYSRHSVEDTRIAIKLADWLKRELYSALALTEADIEYIESAMRVCKPGIIIK